MARRTAGRTTRARSDARAETRALPLTLAPAALALWCRAALRGAPEPGANYALDDDILRILDANRLTPFVASALAALGDPALRPLELRARMVRERALAQLRVLREVATVLDGAGVRWMLWKGPALMQHAWGDATLRVSSDLDVVVVPGDRDRARASLDAAGWAAADGLSREQERVIHAGSRAYPLVRGPGEAIELHWAFADRSLPDWSDVEDVFARSEAVTIAGVQVRTPSGADAVLLSALHATKHGWSQADEVVTFAKLYARSGVPWSDLQARAEQSGVSRAIHLARELVSFLESGIHASAAVDECVARMCAGDAAWRPSHAWTISWMRRRRDRIRYWMTALFAPTRQESNWVRLPSVLAYAYPIVRLARLSLRAVGVVRR